MNKERSFDGGMDRGAGEEERIDDNERREKGQQMKKKKERGREGKE